MPDWHREVEQVKNRSALTQRGWYLGNWRKGPRDLDNHGLPTVCENLLSSRVPTDYFENGCTI
jgi:hypothetical protein